MTTAPAGSTPPGVHGALIRYRIMAIVVGIGLLVLVFLGIPLQVWADDHAVVDVVGPVHGFLYIVYLVTAADLTRRVGWPIVRLVWMALAGVIPFGAFVEERRVTRRVRATPAAPGSVGT